MAETALEAHAEHYTHAHQFDDYAQQTESVFLGMWAFLATEVLFFGALFAAYFVYRYLYYDAYAASATEYLNTGLGMVNTLVLLVSSFTMALGVHAAQMGNRAKTSLYLIATILLACVFLGVKVVEYKAKYDHHVMPGMATFGEDFAHEADMKDIDVNHARVFFSLYFCMTGLHALHIVIGIGALLTILFLNQRKWFSPSYYSPVEMVGLYWHFVDVVWVFLFPLLYLIPKVHQ